MGEKNIILIVEDDPLVRETVAFMLEEAGFEVLTAETGEEASYLLPKLKRIDLLLTDIRMPGRINGWVLADMARCRRPNLPVVYTSAYSSQRAREVENSVFLAKPYLPSDILKIVAELVVAQGSPRYGAARGCDPNPI